MNIAYCSDFLASNFTPYKRRICGRNEFEIYKNFVDSLPSTDITRTLGNFFNTFTPEKKDNLRSSLLRNAGNLEFKNKNYYESAIAYTKSLCFAEYNSEEYAFALANRSAALYEIEEYESCVMDINLCLKAPYPNKLKPKVLIRQAKCFKEMGDSVKMRETCLDILDSLDQDIYELSIKENGNLILSY